MNVKEFLPSIGDDGKISGSLEKKRGRSSFSSVKEKGRVEKGDIVDFGTISSAEKGSGVDSARNASGPKKRSHERACSHCFLKATP